MTIGTTAPTGTAVLRRLPAAALVSASAVLLFGVQWALPGYLALVAGLIFAFVVDRPLFRDLALIAIGLAIISTISLEANIDYANILLMGTVLSLSVAVPFAISRLVYKERSIRFPWRAGRWRRAHWIYLLGVVIAGWGILPLYFIGSGAYRNWPAIEAPDELARLFVGVNAVGIWDELFFVCTVFALLRRHFPIWLANVLQAVIFVSFLWELGYREWGPLLTVPFALLQGYTFNLTKSLGFVIAVHLLFDLVVFLVLVHAHNPTWPSVFLF